jgi:hypothetical protein
VNTEVAQATTFNEGIAKAMEFGLAVTGEIVSGDPISQIGAAPRTSPRIWLS